MPVKNIKPRPVKAREALDASLPPILDKPALGSEIMRAEQVSIKDEHGKDYSVGFEDIDEAVFYYFNNVIKPSVTEDDARVKVPVIYAQPEMWKSAQADGGVRDKDGKILFPVIAIKKDNIEKVRSITSKVDGNKARNYFVFQEKYTKNNQYSNFNVLNNRVPAKSFRVVIVPDYYKITYTCSVFVNYKEDLNKILEAISYASDSYWGDTERFTFMARIDSMPITQEINQGENRKVSSTFTITLNGHIVPDSINRYMSSANKFFSKTQVNFTSEVVTNF